MTGLWAADHDLSGLDEGNGGVAAFKGQFADGIGGDDGSNVLVANGEDDFCEQAFDGDFEDGAEQLIAAADAA